MTREQQLECLEIIAKTFDLEICVKRTQVTESRGFSFSGLETTYFGCDETITLCWAHISDDISNTIYVDTGRKFDNGELMANDLSHKQLGSIISLVQEKTLLCHKLYGVKSCDIFFNYYVPYRNAYVPSFNSPEELRLKFAIANGK